MAHLVSQTPTPILGSSAFSTASLYREVKIVFQSCPSKTDAYSNCLGVSAATAVRNSPLKTPTLLGSNRLFLMALAKPQSAECWAKKYFGNQDRLLAVVPVCPTKKKSMSE